MRWLFLIGVTFDGVGAFLIAWPILWPGSVSREVTRPRFGGRDKWEPVRRIRDQRFVQYGALFLVAGFALQAIGFIARFDHDWWLAVLVVLAVGAAGLAIGEWLTTKELPRHRWYEEMKPLDAIADQRHIFSVSTIEDWRALFELWFRDMSGKQLEPIELRGIAFIQGGVWLVNCPRCHQPAIAWPANPDAICDECRAVFSVDFPPPETRERMERDLVQEPDPDVRRWVGNPDDPYPP